MSESQRFDEIFENKKCKFDVVQFQSFLKGQPYFGKGTIQVLRHQSGGWVGSENGNS